ncbi:MAG: hypothetical protein Q9165_008787 [Trypethelium subeluteriae]
MAPCDHISWIQLAGAEDCTVTDTNRLSRIVYELINPRYQDPAIVFFLGSRAKDVALRQIYPHNNFRRGRSGGIANIRVDNQTVGADRPIIFADGDLSAPIPPSHAMVTCHHDQTFPISWPYPSPQSLVDAILAKLLLPFACVLVVFVEDLNSADEFRDALLRWVSLGIYGNLPNQHIFWLNHCPLCRAPGRLSTQLKPPTAGVRLLSVDGGGTRGVIPLENLRLLQEQLEPDLHLQDAFDFAIGTSSGGLIVLGLCLRRWDAAQCSSIFDAIVKRFFANHNRLHDWLIPQLRRYLRYWVDDGCYNAVALEDCLKTTFDARSRMFDFGNTKVAVTATTISDASSFIFTNYNASSLKRRACGYQSVAHSDPSEEPLVWEAARATSAAPMFV